MTHYTIAADEKVGLNLPQKEHRALANCSLEVCAELQSRARDTAGGSEIPYTLEEFESLHGALTSLVDRSDDRRQKKLLKKVAGRIERILDQYADPEPPDHSYEDDVPEAFIEAYRDIVQLTDQFCDQRLNGEYKQMCREMGVGLCQPGSPVERGKREGWACGIVYSVGWVNFLTDPQSTPHVRAEEIAQGFGVSVATMHNKARVLREGLDLVRFAPEYTLPSLAGENPLAWIVEFDGMLIDLRNAPLELQEAAAEAGLIPYVSSKEESRSDADNAPYTLVYDRIGPSGEEDHERPTPTDRAFELKITLEGSDPPIWRRVRAPDCTLDDLHFITQCAMGWEDCHLHEFHAGDERFRATGDEEFDQRDRPKRDELLTLLSELVDEGHKRLSYWYDFGDDWWHKVEVTETAPLEAEKRYPVCIAGDRACPPEDIGGVWGYVDFLEALANKEHPQHEDYLEWCGGGFDPDEFDVDIVNEELAEAFETGD